MPASLTLAEFSDLDFLFVVEDSYDNSGTASSAEIAERIGIDADHPTSCVGTRLGWACRYGFVEKKEIRPESGGKENRYRLTEAGEALIHPKAIPAAVKQMLEGGDEGQRVAAIDSLTRELPGVSRAAAHMARRTYTHNFGGWRDPSIAPKRA